MFTELIILSSLRLKNILTFYKLFMGMLPHGEINQAELAPYLRPPPPPTNSFIKARANSPQKLEAVVPIPNRISSRRLIKPMLNARAEATTALGVYLRSIDGISNNGIVEFLKGKGARIPA